MRKIVLFTLLALVSCDSPISLEPPQSKQPPVEAPSLPPSRVDEPFSWGDYRGFSAFALAGYPPEHIRAVYAQALSHGWNTARVCAETEYWDDMGFLKRVPRDQETVRRLLDTVATIPGAQVLLMPNCTLKGPVSIEEQKRWNHDVLETLRAGRYKNVAIEVVNEFWRWDPDWGPYRLGKQDVVYMIREAQNYGYAAGADDHICLGEASIPHRLYGIASFYSFHPCRSDERGLPWDPDESYLRRMVAVNGGFIVLSETVAYSETEDGGLRTRDRKRIEQYIATCASVPGCKFTYHSDFGLEAKSYPWFPNTQ